MAALFDPKCCCRQLCQNQLDLFDSQWLDCGANRMDFHHLPIVSRAYLGAALAITCGVSFGWFSERHVNLQFARIGAGELWRLGSVFYQGPSLRLVSLLFAVMEESAHLETVYYNDSLRYGLMLCIIGLVSMVASAALKIRTPGPILLWTVDYLYSRRYQRANPRGIPRIYIYVLFGLFNPFFDTESRTEFAVATLIGHVFYYLEDLLPTTSDVQIFKWFRSR